MVGAWSRGKLDREAKAKLGSDRAKLLPADFVEEARSIADDDGNADDGIPDNIAEAAQTGECGIDLVPVGVGCRVLWGSNGNQAARSGGNGAGVGDVELKRSARSERSWKRRQQLRATGRCGRSRS